MAASVLPSEVRSDLSAAALTSIGVGGPIAHLWPVQHPQDARNALAYARDRDLPWWVLGGGSNVVAADAGLLGVVVQPAKPAGLGVEILDVSDKCVLVRVRAGVAWDELVAHSVAQGWQGIECLSGIPGQVGAAPIQNIGAYGQEFSEVAVAVHALDTRTLASVRLESAACQFGYRSSVFKTNPDQFIVLGVDVALQRDRPPCLAYAQVRDALAETAQPSLTQVRQTVLALRRAKGMVLDPNDPDSRSCGSFFVNPVVPAETAAAVLADLVRPGETAPRWPQPAGTVKLSAAWLLERCGLGRGHGQGRVGLSTKHTLAVVNRGGATAAEVLAFADEVAQAVQARCGVTLLREPVLLGTPSLGDSAPTAAT